MRAAQNSPTILSNLRACKLHKTRTPSRKQKRPKRLPNSRRKRNRFCTSFSQNAGRSKS